MRTSRAGIELIKRFEGCRLTAYKPIAAEQHYTIGYGHYGPDVAPGMKITQAQAEAILAEDLKKYENAVDSTLLILNQNQFDALVSFSYNCGVGSLRSLTRRRTVNQIADALLLYNKGSGRVLPGLTRRRQAERALFLSGISSDECPYKEPTKSVKYGSKGDSVRWIQWMLVNAAGYSGLKVDGIAGKATVSAIMEVQKAHGLVFDGIAGKLTRQLLKDLYLDK